jgi:predicted type IV restriction endonuclease
MDMREDIDAVASGLKRVAEMPAGALVSEEDVKNKVVLPILRALGYDDGDFNYERRTGRGYVDVAVEQFPVVIVVEAKAPRTKLDNYREQLETYVFHKHGRDRVTVAILTDGERFIVYGVTGALFRGSLEDHRILSFTRSEISTAALLPKLLDLLGKKSNQEGTISDAIERYGKDRERVEAIETDLRTLITDRKRIDIRIHELEAERTAILGLPDRYRYDAPASTYPGVYSQVASLHILRLLKEREAFSKPRGVDRKWLDEQLINKVEGIRTNQAVSFGLIELKDKRQIDYEGRPIRSAWLIETREKSVT